MLRDWHRDEYGKFNIIHAILILLVVATAYTVGMYYPPYYQFIQIKTAAKETALKGSLDGQNDRRNKGWFDAEMENIDVEYPTSRDLVYYRYSPEQVEVAFEYDYDVNHPIVGTHRLHFTYRCVAVQGRCRDL